MEKRRIFLGFCSIAYRNEPLEQIIPRLAKIGYDGIEVFFQHVQDRDAASLASLRRLADDNGIALFTVSPYFAFTRGQKEYDDSIETAKKAVAVAQALGVKKIRTFVDVANTGLASANATSALWEQAMRGLRTITALDRDLEFVVETHEYTLADTVPTTQRLMKETDAPNLKINFQANEEFRKFGVNAAFDALQPWISHMHVAQITPDHADGYVENAGELDIVDFIGHIKRAGYSGSMSVEYCWQNVPAERAETAYRFLAPLLGE